MCIEGATGGKRIKSREKIGKRKDRKEDKRGKGEKVRSESMCSIEESLKRRVGRRA